jgi:hypothetical protein
VIIADKGFYSEKNVTQLTEEGLQFILPLKRDSLLSAIKKTPYFFRISFLGIFIKVSLPSDFGKYPSYSALFY